MAMDAEVYPDRVAIRGVEYPRSVSLRRLLVTGPPRSGKSTLVAAIGGWPEEGYLDLGVEAWWRNRLLTFRPREVHLGLPFVGFDESHAIFDPEWIANPASIDFARVHLPPPKRHFYQVDWLHRFVFDFQLPPPEELYRVGRDRARRGTHLVDDNLTLTLVTRQHAVYEDLARLLHRAGFQVIVRCRYGGPPKRIRDDRESRPAAPAGATEHGAL